uniref:MIA SH3 domain containing n=1 Tax=Anolis carolinensis TaxID=28377 RepID=H9GK12_ANOCA
MGSYYSRVWIVSICLSIIYLYICLPTYLSIYPSICLSIPLCLSLYPISIAVALQDYIAPDCRFINIQRGQVVYVFSKLKGRGRLFWGGSVQGDYYGEQPARLGYFPSAVVQENQYLKPGKIEVKTSRWDFYCQ